MVPVNLSREEKPLALPRSKLSHAADWQYVHFSRKQSLGVRQNCLIRRLSNPVFMK